MLWAQNDEHSNLVSCETNLEEISFLDSVFDEKFADEITWKVNWRSQSDLWKLISLSKWDRKFVVLKARERILHEIRTNWLVFDSS